MNKWLRRVRGAVGMGLTWAAAWAVGGVLIGVTSILLPGLPWESFFEVFDAPLPALAMPGFVGGALFSLVLGIAGRRRSFHELSLPRVAAWGAVGGLLLTLFPFALVALGMASLEGGKFGAWHIISVIGGPFILLSALSAAGSLMLARMGKDREPFGADEDGPQAGLPEGGSAELLGAGEFSPHRHSAARPGERIRPDPARGRGNA